MKRLFFAYAFALVGVLLPVLPADAGTPVYAGNLQVTTNASLKFLAGGSGCMLVNNGVAYIAACPIGTVAFSAASPFTVTGTGPYVIGCPTCFTTAGGTITGATTFSQAITVGPSSYGPSSTTVHGEIRSNAGVNNFSFPSYVSSGYTAISVAGGGAQVQGVVPNMMGIGNEGVSYLIAADTTGNAGFAGQVTASQFNVGSKRAWKYDIHPLPFDALQVLFDTHFAAFRYRPGHGDPRLPHIGIIADDSPSVLSGEKHDHLDIEALATVDAKAILQLEAQINVLYIILASLTLLVLLLGMGLGIVWHRVQTDD